MSARSDCLCGVTFRRGQRASFPCDHTTSNAWDGTGSLSNVSSNIRRNLSGTTLQQCYRGATCRLWADIRFRPWPLQCAHHAYSPCDIGTYKHPACSSRTPPACPHSSSYPPSESFSCLAALRFLQPHHCLPQWLASIFLTSSLRPATAREQSNVGGLLGNHSIAPHCERRIDDRVLFIFTLFVSPAL